MSNSDIKIKMMIPIRCFSCGSVIGNKWDLYQEYLRQGISAKDSLDKMKLRRFCCRRMILGHVDLVDKMLMYCDDHIRSEKLN
jgi:DNA-directed RNA polymerase I, II, and III subunit RPABC5